MRIQAAAVLTSLLSLLSVPLWAGVNRWTPIGPETASVCELAVAPSRPGTVYAGLSRGGVYRSLDGGATWTAARERLPLQNRICQIAVDAASPGTVYAGTQERGVWKTTDGGATWAQVNQGLPGHEGFFLPIHALKADPRTPGVVYAIAFRTLFKTTNGGKRWVTMISGLPNGFPNLAIDPVKPANLYMTASASARVFKSKNGGVTWTSSAAGLPPGADIRDLEIDPKTPTALYLSSSKDGVFKSIDGGRSWSLENAGLPGPTVPADPLYGELVLVSTCRQQTLYVDTARGFYKTTNGAVTWNMSTYVPEGTQVLEAASGTLLAGTAKHGVFRSLNDVSTWTPSSRGLTAGNVSSLAVDFNARLYAVDSRRLYQSSDGGASWAEVFFPETELGYGEFTGGLALTPGIAYASSGVGVFRTTDGGVNWSFAGSVGCAVPFLLKVDPAHPTTLFAGTSFTQECGCTTWKSVDGGADWTCIGSGLPSFSTLISAIDPFDPDHLFSLYETSVIYESTDGGASWSQLARLPEFSNWITFDPVTPGRVYAASGAGITRSEDGGHTWTEIVDELSQYVPVPIVIDPVRPNVLYVGTRLEGVLKSTDSGATWNPLGPGLEGLVVTGIALDPQNRTVLYAATEGGGVMKITQRRR